jgi:tetratricopeptide (TPR) repeat protein
VTEAAAPPAPPRRPSFYEAVALYESGVRGLQRHDYDRAAEAFRLVVQRFPEERELLERAGLYLRVCERETDSRPLVRRRSTAERLSAATAALNAGDPNAAFAQVQAALEQDQGSAHAHYLMAVALTARAEHEQALSYLARAIELNPHNRSIAKQDDDLNPLRSLEEFRRLVLGAGSQSLRQSR